MSEKPDAKTIMDRIDTTDYAGGVAVIRFALDEAVAEERKALRENRSVICEDCALRLAALDARESKRCSHGSSGPCSVCGDQG